MKAQEDARQTGGKAWDDFFEATAHHLSIVRIVGPWIWIANPYAGSESDEEADLARFMKRSRKALEVYEGQKKKTAGDEPRNEASYSYTQNGVEQRPAEG